MHTQCIFYIVKGISIAPNVIFLFFYLIRYKMQKAPPVIDHEIIQKITFCVCGRDALKNTLFLPYKTQKHLDLCTRQVQNNSFLFLPGKISLAKIKPLYWYWNGRYSGQRLIKPSCNLPSGELFDYCFCLYISGNNKIPRRAHFKQSVQVI